MPFLIEGLSRELCSKLHRAPFDVKQNLISSILRPRAASGGPMEILGHLEARWDRSRRSRSQWGEVVAAQVSRALLSPFAWGLFGHLIRWEAVEAAEAAEAADAADPGGGLHHAKNCHHS